MLQFKAVSNELHRLLKFIQQQPVFGELRLVGGTALALQYGHRESIDLDFFGQVELDDLAGYLLPYGSLKLIRSSSNIKIYLINGIKVDFVNYNYPWLDAAIVEEGVILASDKDIAAMKIAAITGRGSKKDFIDLYFILQKYPLAEIMGFYLSKFPDATEMLALKSLVYFSDAEAEPMPKMIMDINWEDIKSVITSKTMGLI